MRIVSASSPSIKLYGASGAGAGKTQAGKKTLKLGWEDLILGFALVVILVSWIQGTFTPDQVLAYLGFTTAGGAWGLLSKRGK